MKLSLTTILTPTLIAAALAGAGPASAAAPAQGDPAWGQTICLGARCETPPGPGVQPDSTRWSFEWGSFDPWTVKLSQPITNAQGVTVGTYAKRIYKRFHQNRADRPFLTVTQVTAYYNPGQPYQSGVTDVAITDDPSANSIQCGELDASTGQIIDGTAGPGVIGNPDIEAQCGVKPRPAKPVAADPVAVSPPAKSAACAPITVARKRIAVTSTGLGCTGARNMLAKFMRTGAEPDGWVCTKLAVGKARSASCGTPSRAAKRVVGRWRA